MSVRVGIDVGGTFTKAVACEPSGAVVARAVVPTTHASTLGVIDGVIAALERVGAEVRRLGAGPITLVSHSTTQAVNALLEGDSATVGVIGIGRRPDLRRAQRRTQVGAIRVAPGRELRTFHAFLDATDGITREHAEDAIRSLVAQGAAAICVSEAFGVEDPDGELLVREVAESMGVPSCAGHELTGLYGLELRTVTGAINASILPAALATAGVVERAVAEHAAGAPLLVMRGDGGAADAATMRRRPLLTAFSGPAASVAGALHHARVHDGVVIEVGGTSTNVSAIRGGRPLLSYVRVLEHVTCVRSLDVRVAGVAGGSMLRIARKLGRHRVTGVGPRSAHIAGLAYASFATAEELDGCRALLVAPREGDPAGYAVVETASGARYAVTLTCAANALGVVPETAHARGDGIAARIAFEALGRAFGRDWRELAGEAQGAAVAALAPLANEVIAEHRLASPSIAGVGGGAGAIVPALADALGLAWSIPPDADVISSIGDATSLVRVEIERALPRDAPPAAMARLIEDAEEAVVRAGAAPDTLQVETEPIPERGAVRAIAVGSVALDADEPVGNGFAAADPKAIRDAAAGAIGDGADLLVRSEAFSVFAAGSTQWRRYAVVDRRGTISSTGEAVVVTGSGTQLARTLPDEIAKLVRHIGPVSVAPAIRLVRSARVVDLSVLSSPKSAVDAAVAECELAGGESVVALLCRP